MHPTSEDTLKSLSETFINSTNVVTNVVHFNGSLLFFFHDSLGDTN